MSFLFLFENIGFYSISYEMQQEISETYLSALACRPEDRIYDAERYYKNKKTSKVISPFEVFLRQALSYAQKFGQ